MSKVIKLGVCIFFSVFVIGAIFCGHIIASEVSTPQEYIDFLVEKGKTDPEALKVKGQFEKLPTKKQKRFVEYLNDPELVKALFSDIEPNTEKKLYGGTVVIKHTLEQNEIISDAPEEPSTGLKHIVGMMAPCFLSTVEAAPVKKQFQLKHTKAVEAFGINVSWYNVWLKYEAIGTKVTKIIGGNGYYSNVYPCTGISMQSCDKYIYGNKAHTAVVWSVSIGVPGINATGTVHHHVLGNASGGKSYRFWKEG